MQKSRERTKKPVSCNYHSGEDAKLAGLKKKPAFRAMKRKHETEKRNGKKMCEICVSELPLELLRDIGRHLDVCSLANVRSTCRSLRRLESSEDVENAAKLLRDVFDARTKENARRRSPEIANAEEVTRRALRDAIARDCLLKRNKVDPLIALRAYEAGDLDGASCDLLARFFGQTSFSAHFEDIAIVRDDVDLVFFMMKKDPERENSFTERCLFYKASKTLALMCEKADENARAHILQDIMNKFMNGRTRWQPSWRQI